MDDKKIPHFCEGRTADAECGPAILSCYTYDNGPGELWAGNGEYASQVAFCPYCGYKAEVPPVVTPPQRNK